MTKEYDLAVLGGGTGGYVSAIRASQLGMKVAIIEKEKIGGTCLHKGCIPSKALLRSAEVYQQTKKAIDFGVQIENVKLDFQKVLQRKSDIIQKLHLGIQSLLSKHKVDIFYGTGRILGPSIFSPIPGTISIEHDNDMENNLITPKYILIATGSKPNTLQGLPFDGKFILSSDDVVIMETLPKSIIIIGGGVIGMEWASMLADFDVEVTVLEYLDQILPALDQEIAREAEQRLKKKGIRIITDANILTEKTIKEEDKITLNVELKDCIQSFSAEKVLVSVGRLGNISDIGIENTEVELNNGFIQTNEFYQTKESHIYAIGDVIGGMQLAHVAMNEGLVAVSHIVNDKPYPINYETIANCVYTNPEIASVGMTEKEAKEKNFSIKVAKIPFQAIGKAHVFGEMEGFIKLIVDNDTQDLLGAHMIGPQVTDMISEMSLAKFLDATPWEIGATIRPHPTLPEVFSEAGLAVEGMQIHY